MTTEPARRRRRSPAAGGRLLVGGLSVSLLVGLVGAMARGTHTTTNPPSVVVQANQEPSTPHVTHSTSPPVTVSRASR